MPWNTQFFAIIPSKISVVLYFKTESFCVENQIQALTTNAPLQEELSNNLCKEELIKFPHAKLAALTLNFLQAIIFVITWKKIIHMLIVMFELHLQEFKYDWNNSYEFELLITLALLN